MADSTPGPRKVAIPRLYRPGAGVSPEQQKEDNPRKPRVGRACLNCRHRKVKCSGGAPRCTNCVTSDLECAYDQTRRDRLKSATSKNQDLVQLLRELSLRVNDVDRVLIEEALEEHEDDSASNVSTNSMKRRKTLVPGETEREGGEGSASTAADARPSLDSEEGLAHIDEDLLRSTTSRETGYVGQGAEVQWLRSLQGQVKKTQPESADNNRAEIHSHPSAGTTDAYFYLDSDSAELQVHVDLYGLPPVEIAEKLVESYMKTVHRSFPILPAGFEDQCRRYLHAVRMKQRFTVPDRWLATVNMVFAIGAYYSHLVRAEWRGEKRDHLSYMTRTLRLMGPWPFATAPDLSIIQVTGLLSFYYQIIGHVSRGWVMIGISIRQALALGLHLRNDDPRMSVARKETFLRTWWSIHAIECLLSAITGRPCVLSHEDCTVPLPLTLSEESSRSAWVPRQTEDASPTPASNNFLEKSRRLHQPRSYLDAHLNIGLITQKLLGLLYSPRISQQPWSYVQTTIPMLLRELDVWKQGALPAETDCHTETISGPVGRREILLLRFYYFSTKILITRPCLCRHGRRMRGESPTSTDFDQSVAADCVEAALGMTDLLPDEPNACQLYLEGPWWSIVHNMMQAMAVLLLELSYCEDSVRDEYMNVRNSIKKLLRWLRAMQPYDAVVVRAHRIVVNILKQNIFHSSAKDLLMEEDHTQERSDSSSAYDFLRPDSGPYVAEPSYQFSVGMAQLRDPQEAATPMMHQSQSLTDTFQFADGFYQNPYMFANPFMTGFDQGQPLGLSIGELWAQANYQEDNSLPNEPAFNYQGYPDATNQNLSDL